ncbi:MAG: aminoglycoside 6-adenylyltransferase [Chloroflexota bacterium]
MRSEQEMLELIVNTAQNDERVRAVILNGSRANPDAPRDIFQDWDIVYLVTDVSSFKNDPTWINRFGEIMISQMPDAMQDPPAQNNGGFTYLMQFTDGNRIDLRLFPISKLDGLENDSLSILILDKDGLLTPFAPPSECDYLPKPPTAKAFSDCCNEFWWVCPYVAKGLWREEIVYAKYMLDQIVREQLFKMIVWYVGTQTRFSWNPGKFGKYLKRYLEPELWEMLQATYSNADYENTWQALFTMCDLFRTLATCVATHYGFDYPYGDDARVSAHLRHVRVLPKNASAMY